MKIELHAGTDNLRDFELVPLKIAFWNLNIEQLQ